MYASLAGNNIKVFIFNHPAFIDIAHIIFRTRQILNRIQFVFNLYLVYSYLSA